MKKFISILSAAAMLGQFSVLAEENPTKTIYLSVTGEDTNDGTSSEKALKSFSAAKAMVEEYKTAGAAAVKVIIGEGTYYADSELAVAGGTESCSVEYAADGNVVISGAKELSWDAFSLSEREDLPKAAAGKVYEADLSGLFSSFAEYPTGYYGNTSDNYYQLYCNDSEQTLARYPNTGYMTGEKVAGAGMRLTVPDEKAALWAGRNKINLNGYIAYDWAYARTYIENVDQESSTIDVYNLGQIEALSAENRFFVLDLIEELDTAGEFYIDRERERLYYYPEMELSADDTIELTSTTGRIMNVSGLKNLTISGITFDKTRGRAIYGKACADIEIKNCTFKNIGWDAVYLSGTDITIRENSFLNIGARGVDLYGGDEDTLTESGSIIERCYFDGVGLTYRSYQGAIKLTGCGHVVKNNTMKNTPHHMIGYGGVFNKIIFNDIERACTDSGDMGAIYAGRSAVRRANEIAYNYIHDVRSDHSSYYLVAGIYMDDGLCGQYIHHNIIKNASEGIFLAGGSDNSVHDNILIDCTSALTLSQGNGKENNAQAIFDEAEKYLESNELYKKTFPTINYIDSTKTLARGNFIHDNLIVNSGCKLYYGTVSALMFGTGTRTNRRFNNIMVDEFDDFCDAENEDYAIRKGSGILKSLPQLAEISMEKLGQNGSGGEYSYAPYVKAELSDAINSTSERVENGEYEVFEEISELIAKAEVNGIVTDEYKKLDNYKKYSAMRDKWNTPVFSERELDYNYSSIYTSDFKYQGGAGYSGSFYRPHFIEKLNWKYEWTDDLVDNTLYSYNKYIERNVGFFMRVPDYSVTPNTYCVVKNDNTYKTNTGKYWTMAVDGGRYTSVELLANSDRPTDYEKVVAVRLEYSDGSVEYSEYKLNAFPNGASSEGIAGITSTKTWEKAETAEDLTDLGKRAYINGNIAHYSIKTDSTKELVSVGILNDKYDWQTDSNGKYMTDDDGERIVLESQYAASDENNGTKRTQYKRTATIYAITLVSNELLRPTVYSAEITDICDAEGLSTDLEEVGTDFSVKVSISRNNDESTGVCIVGVYEDNRLVSVVTKAAETEEITAEFENVSFGTGERKIRLFVWDGLDSMCPIMYR